MEEELIDVVPCSSLAVDAILRIGTVTRIYLLFHNTDFNDSITKRFVTRI